MLSDYLNKVFHCDAMTLLKRLPAESIDAVISDWMYGTSQSRACLYDWGCDPAKGNAKKHWQYHQPLYEQCRRVVKPNGIIGIAQGAKFAYDGYFDTWFGGHRIWLLGRFVQVQFACHVWMVQTANQHPICFPNASGIIRQNRRALHELSQHHPCPKPTEEMHFMVTHLTKPGDIILDCCCGLGSTLVAAAQLGRRYIGCDKSRRYCQIAMNRLQPINMNGSTTGRLSIVDDCGVGGTAIQVPARHAQDMAFPHHT